MNIQLALDRLSIEEAINIVTEVKDYVNWIEVGTSLIKEFGVESVRQIKSTFPDKIVLADMKTMDNVKYELELCFEAGADVSTVMGTAPFVTIEKSLEIAANWNKEIMIDLLNTEKRVQERLLNYDAIFCSHVSKDEQEFNGNQYKQTQDYDHLYQSGKKLAFAGGITLDSVKNLSYLKPHVVIIGSAITKANNKLTSAQAFHSLALEGI